MGVQATQLQMHLLHALMLPFIVGGSILYVTTPCNQDRTLCICAGRQWQPDAQACSSNACMVCVVAHTCLSHFRQHSGLNIYRGRTISAREALKGSFHSDSYEKINEGYNVHNFPTQHGSFIPSRTYPIPLDLGSQAGLGENSTAVGDHVGSPRDELFCLLLWEISS